ncbi:MAG: hypothetical protein HY271_07925 [Deltaproteobacteria bacterium]|nr:hypothetical protein [Deltaproteobacteria bacterium]
MTGVLFVAGACVVTVLARAAFCHGRRLGTSRLPPGLGAELRAHKLECLGEPAERVDLELRLLLGEAPSERGAVMRLVGTIRHWLAPAASVFKRTGTAARRS